MALNLSSKRNLIPLLMGASCLFVGNVFAADVLPHTAKPGEKWVLQDDRSDEFEFEDTRKWDFQPNLSKFGLGRKIMPSLKTEN